MNRSVIFFNDSFPPVIDGVANVVLNYARILGEMGWNCTVVAPDAPGTPRGEEVKVLRYTSLPLPGRYPFRIGIPAVVGTVVRPEPANLPAMMPGDCTALFVTTRAAELAAFVSNGATEF